MNEHSQQGARTVALTLLGAVLFHRPLLDVFDAGADATVGGIPVLFLYLFGAWALLIVLLGVVIERADSDHPGS
ncbi:MAG: hypothetical protein ACR2PO_08945 [Methyloligellaceae bacterium]